MKIAYLYSPITMEFLGTRNIELTNGYEDYRLPQCATWANPEDVGELAEFQCYVFSDLAWQIEADYRNQTIYSTENGEMSETVDYIGEIEDGYTLKKPQTTYDKWSTDQREWVTDVEAQKAGIVEQNKRDAITTKYNATYADIIYNDQSYLMGPGDDGVMGIDNIRDFAFAVLTNSEIGDESLPCITSDGQIVMITYNDIKQIYFNFLTRKQQINAQYFKWLAGDKTQAFAYVES